LKRFRDVVKNNIRKFFGGKAHSVFHPVSYIADGAETMETDGGSELFVNINTSKRKRTFGLLFFFYKYFSINSFFMFKTETIYAIITLCHLMAF